MNNYIKWWKSKFFLLILLIIFITMIVTFLVAYFTNGYYQLLAIPIACIGGFIIRKLVINKIDKLNDYENNS